MAGKLYRRRLRQQAEELRRRPRAARVPSSGARVAVEAAADGLDGPARVAVEAAAADGLVAAGGAHSDHARSRNLSPRCSTWHA
jgi:hypothetical protein